MPAFRIFENSLQARFHASRADVQIFGGGFGNGKTANTIIKTLQLAKDYPGCNGLIARSTLPKLNDTIRAEFIKWCPSAWIKQFNKPEGKSSTCVLKNGSTINFRYIAQQGKREETSTSNLLSATYDFVVVDQMEDPEISHKDFLDLFGRLRGQARYIGNDSTMPRVGPGWMILTTNPTRNWLYRKLILPYHVYKKTGRRLPDLLVHPVTNEPLIELFEGSTYENRENLPAGFIERMEAAYHGQMRSRFLMGEWGGFEGLVYSKFNRDLSAVTEDQMRTYLEQIIGAGFKVKWIESLDYGIAVPTCYLLGFVDPRGNAHIVDGFNKAELSASDIISRIKELRYKWTGSRNAEQPILADPSIFRRQSGEKKTVGSSTADMLHDNGKGVICIRGNNDIMNGIAKVQSYMVVIDKHINPYTREYGAPYLYINDNMDFLLSQIEDYYWAKDTEGMPMDKPKDGNDDACDSLKYWFSFRPEIANINVTVLTNVKPQTQWRERDMPTVRHKKARHK